MNMDPNLLNANVYGLRSPSAQIHAIVAGNSYEKRIVTRNGSVFVDAQDLAEQGCE